MKNLGIRLYGKLTEILFSENISGILQDRRAYNNIKKYAVKPESYLLPSKAKREGLDNPIWICWLQGENAAPPIVKACIKSVRKNISGNIRIITEKNYFDYVTIPDYVIDKYRKGVITRTHFSDILRLALLYEYGGLWIDATVYIMGNVPYQWIKSELFMFHISSYGNEFKVTGSWWITCKDHHPLITAWYSILLEYWKNENTLVDYFLLHKLLRALVDEHSQYKDMIDNMFYFETGPTHLLRKQMDNQYNETVWNKIKETCPIQKLTYKRENTHDKTDNSFYAYCCNLSTVK